MQFFWSISLATLYLESEISTHSSLQSSIVSLKVDEKCVRAAILKAWHQFLTWIKSGLFIDFD